MHNYPRRPVPVKVAVHAADLHAPDQPRFQDILAVSLMGLSVLATLWVSHPF
jgi:hypothetical protein